MDWIIFGQQYRLLYGHSNDDNNNKKVFPVIVTTMTGYETRCLLTTTTMMMTMITKMMTVMLMVMMLITLHFGGRLWCGVPYITYQLAALASVLKTLLLHMAKSKYKA